MSTPIKNEEREDVKRNRALIRAAMVDFIKNERRAATVQELCEITGLSDKTVKAHKKHIKLGDGKANIYQDLTHDVVMAIYKKAKGYTLPSEKLMPRGVGMGETVIERHDIEVHYPADTAAAKLFLQLVEGFSERKETKHSGEVKGSGAFTFNYLAPKEPPSNE